MLQHGTFFSEICKTKRVTIQAATGEQWCGAFSSFSLP